MIRAAVCMLLFLAPHAWPSDLPQLRTGIDLASNGDFQAAYHVLLAGWNRTKDSRFLPELAAVSYRLQNPVKAKEYLFKILKEKPLDRYANDFLGTLFLLEGNVEACLKYWNQIGKPHIGQIHFSRSLHNRELSGRALTISPFSYLKVEDYLASDSRLDMLDGVNNSTLQMEPLGEVGKFNLTVNGVPKRSSFDSKIQILKLAGQALFSQLVKPEFFLDNGVYSSSLISWEEFRHRAYSSLSMPFYGSAHQKIRLFADARLETWALGDDVDLSRMEAGVELIANAGPRLSWTGGGTLSYRNYQNSPDTGAFQEGFYTSGFMSLRYSILRVPERRFFVDASSYVEVASDLDDFRPVMKLEQSLEIRWLPTATEDDLAVSGRLQSGIALGKAPFDEYYVLGVDRDTDLQLRAHRSDIDRKGGDPLGPRFFLVNLDFSKKIIQQSRWSFRVTPFVDVGWVSQTDLWKSHNLFVDTGVQAGFRFFGSPEIVTTYGKDLRTGGNVVYLGAKF